MNPPRGARGRTFRGASASYQYESLALKSFSLEKVFRLTVRPPLIRINEMSVVDQDVCSLFTVLILHEQSFVLTSSHTCLLIYLRNTIQNKHHTVPSISVTSQIFVSEIWRYYVKYIHGFHKFQSPALGFVFLELERKKKNSFLFHKASPKSSLGFYHITFYPP